MPELYIIPTKRRIEIPEKAHAKLRIIKVWYPDDTPIKLGKRIVRLDEIDPWPPAIQQGLKV